MAPLTIYIDKGKGSGLGATFELDAGCIVIKNIQKTGWLHGTGLIVGHEVISVDGNHCSGLSIDKVEQFFENAPATFIVMVDNPMDTQRRKISFNL